MTTSTTPVEAGTTYPMPPRPSWATGLLPDLTEGSIGWDREVDGGVGDAIGVTRRDWIRPDGIEVGATQVYVDLRDQKLSPDEARHIADLLISAARMAES